jgi:hypothetical protein
LETAISYVSGNPTTTRSSEGSPLKPWSGSCFVSYEPGRLPDAGQNGFKGFVVPAYAQRLIESTSSITLPVEAGAPFSKYAMAPMPTAMVAE